MNALGIAAAALLALCCTVSAQIVAPGAPITGNLHVSADDNSIVYLNGQEVFRSELSKKERVAVSGPVTLKAGDHLVFRVHNYGGPKGLLVQFVSSDRKTLIQFPRSSYRVLANPEATDFRDTEFRDSRLAQLMNRSSPAAVLLYKTKSQWVWGHSETCVLGVVISREMVEASAL
jgi:hypothetical protein